MRIGKRGLAIELEGIKFLAFHGVLDQERQVGNTFVVDLRLELSNTDSLDTDNLSDTVSYAEVYDILSEQMSIPSLLLEHIAGRMATRILDAFPMIMAIKLRLSKQKPPISGDIKMASVEVSLSRE